MKILVVEDNNDKIEKLLCRIIGVSELTRDDVDVAFTGEDARKFLTVNVYDLMILDIILPFRPGDSPKAESASNLLLELRDRRTLKKPKQIIGLTAYDEGLQALLPIFSEQTWGIVKYSAESSDWGDQIARAVEWLASAGREIISPSYGCDVAVITALDTPEYDALLRNGWQWAPAEPLDDTTFVRKASFTSSGNTFSAASAYCPKMGLVPAALIAAKIVTGLRPKFLVMSGICGGVKGRVNYGDPVIADPCWDWQRGKHILKEGEQEFEIRPEQLPLAQEIRSRWEQLRADKSFWSSLKDAWPSAPDTELRVRLGPSVSGASVLANPAIVEDIKTQHGGLLAVEMEAYAVMAAASLAARPRPVAFSCKSVCDFADEKKDDKWQTYASYTSARAITEFFERYMFELNN